jgi:PKD repeat protein
MNNRFKLLLVAAGVMALFGITAQAGAVDYSPATYNPEVGEDISFTVCQDSLSNDAVSYDWDFDGDGVYDVSTPQPTVEHAFYKDGFVVVTLRVNEGGGRYTTCKKGLYVGDSSLFAVREVTPDKNGSVLVEIAVSAYDEIKAVGLEETIPVGWQWEILDIGDAVTKKEGQNLQILWMNPMQAGETWIVSYFLYPSAGRGSPSLGGTISGYSNGRVKVSISGDAVIFQ